MIKKLFDWTPRDIAYWEKVHQQGLRRFILWYGMVITAGLFFILFGLVTFFFWLRQVSGGPVTFARIVFLVGQLLVIALVSLLAGLVNSLITWIVEERLYGKYKARS
jgi:hypothetical protein